jgi:hypothetical protein
VASTRAVTAEDAVHCAPQILGFWRETPEREAPKTRARSTKTALPARETDLVLPSFESHFHENRQVKPRILVLEIRDRDDPEGVPIATLILERQECYRRDERDGSVYEASIRLSYERIVPKYSYHLSGKASFSGSFVRGYGEERYGDGPSVSLTSESRSKGAVFLNLPGLKGQRIGTYLMNEIVTWAQQWPEARVRSVELLANQADDENKERRNWFYEQFGLVFDYKDPEHREGWSKPMLVAALSPVERWKQNIRERDVREYLSEVLYDRERLGAELADRKRVVKSLTDQIKQARAHPLRWALRQLWWRFSAPLGTVTIALILGAIVWAKLRP